MVDLVVLQSVSYVAVAIGVVLAALNYIVTSIREDRRSKQNLETRQAQLFMQLYQSATNPELNEAEFMLYDIEFKDLDDWNALLKDKEKYKAWMIYGSCLEGIGVLVRENLIDIRLPALLMSGDITWFWERYKPGISDCRSKRNWPRFLIETEYLYDRVKDYGREHPELQIASPSIT